MPGGIEKVVTTKNELCPRRDGHNFFNPIYTICVYVYIYMYISIHPKSISIHLSKIRDGDCHAI